MKTTIHLKKSTIDYLRNNEQVIFRENDGHPRLINQFGFYIDIKEFKKVEENNNK